MIDVGIWDHDRFVARALATLNQCRMLFLHKKKAQIQGCFLFFYFTIIARGGYTFLDMSKSIFLFSVLLLYCSNLAHGVLIHTAQCQLQQCDTE